MHSAVQIKSGIYKVYDSAAKASMKKAAEEVQDEMPQTSKNE